MEDHTFKKPVMQTFRRCTNQTLAIDSELNDTIVEAELRTLRIPPDLPVEIAVERFQNAKSRLLIAVSRLSLNFISENTFLRNIGHVNM